MEKENSTDGNWINDFSAKTSSLSIMPDYKVGFKDKITAIFGGTGSLGTILAEKILEEEPYKVLLICNSENELWETKNYFGIKPELEMLFCDIREPDSVEQLFQNGAIDIVINCAALKHISYCEEFPYEAVKTNILGLQNLLRCSTKYDVSNFIQVSTDKAVEPLSVMGASKLIGERMVINLENCPFSTTKFSCVRFGNVLGSRGSLVPQLRQHLEKYNTAYITDKNMERYIITKQEIFDFIKKVLEYQQGGEIFIPKMKEVNIMKIVEGVIKEYGNGANIEFIGRGKYEKLREKLYTEYEVVEELDWGFVIKND